MTTEAGAAGADAKETRRLLLAIAALTGVAAAILFVGWPELDLVAARMFNLGPRKFVFNHSELVGALRLGFTLITWGTGIAAVLGIVFALARGRRLFGVSLKEWVFLALVLIIGPGLIANTLLKDNWGRPRPMHVVEFGGPAEFTPVLARSGTCERNCSFISGEASSIFAIGFALALLARRRRTLWLAGAVLAGAAIGLIRIGEGGHFLSDVIFAGVIMGLAVAFLHWLIFDVLAPRMQSEAAWHEQTAEAAQALRSRIEGAYASRSRGKGGGGDPIGPPD